MYEIHALVFFMKCISQKKTNPTTITVYSRSPSLISLLGPGKNPRKVCELKQSHWPRRKLVPMLLVDIMHVVVVDMHKKGALDIRQALQLPPQTLAYVVGFAEAGSLVHDDVNFDVALLAGVIGAALWQNSSIRVIEFGTGRHAQRDEHHNRRDQVH